MDERGGTKGLRRGDNEERALRQGEKKNLAKKKKKKGIKPGRDDLQNMCNCSILASAEQSDQPSCLRLELCPPSHHL